MHAWTHAGSGTSLVHQRRGRPRVDGAGGARWSARGPLFFTFYRAAGAPSQYTKTSLNHFSLHFARHQAAAHTHPRRYARPQPHLKPKNKIVPSFMASPPSLNFPFSPLSGTDLSGKRSSLTKWRSLADRRCAHTDTHSAMRSLIRREATATSHHLQSPCSLPPAAVHSSSLA
jgi:hypothetical protein